jgi:hypothetical protein
MVSLIARAADAANAPVNVLARFDLMRRWHELARISFDRMINPTDGDRVRRSGSSACRVARALCDAVAGGVALVGKSSQSLDAANLLTFTTTAYTDPSGNLKRRTLPRESTDTGPDEPSLPVDFACYRRATPVAGGIASRNPCSSPPTQCGALVVDAGGPAGLVGGVGNRGGIRAGDASQKPRVHDQQR